MRKYHAIIVDDQQASIDLLLSYFAKTEQVQVDAHFTDPIKALTYVRENAIDLVIIDIDLGGRLNGFDWMTAAPKRKIKFIVYTGLHKFEDKGYLMNAVDVLLKPVSQQRFAIALNRLDDRIRLEDTPAGDFDSLEHWYDYINIKKDGKFCGQLIWFKNILYMESSKKYVLIYQANDPEVLFSNSTLAHIYSKLPKNWFKQCARGTIVNVKFFHSYTGKQVKLINHKKLLPVGNLATFYEFKNFLMYNQV